MRVHFLSRARRPRPWLRRFLRFLRDLIIVSETLLSRAGRLRPQGLNIDFVEKKIPKVPTMFFEWRDMFMTHEGNQNRVLLMYLIGGLPL